jgi:hypothetical protein
MASISPAAWGKWLLVPIFDALSMNVDECFG